MQHEITIVSVSTNFSQANLKNILVCFLPTDQPFYPQPNNVLIIFEK